MHNAMNKPFPPQSARAGPGWWYETRGNGAFVTIHAPDGRTAFLQGDSADNFVREISRTNEVYTDVDACQEYESILA